ncbi:MAG: hypothetical protein K2P73_01540 [Lachnospiraceae bacterium]|nr:hypothetical protein [Lachnospiraceae bacterium]
MKQFLNDIRSAENPIPPYKQIINTVCILFIGIILGTFSKFLDTMPTNELPFIFEFLDMRNFLGRFAIWLLIALCISVYSNSSIRASINVFVFFVGMVTSYYLYSRFVAGFFPRSYAMIWAAFTVISPILAFICWYARGKSKLAFMLSAIILAVLFNTTFVYGYGYFEMRSILELIIFICAVAFLNRKTIKETMIMLILSVGIAFALDFIVPFHFG